MAKPIQATPDLEGEEAVNFLNKMEETEKAGLTPYQKKMLKEIKSNRKIMKKTSESKE